jgi:hypothetical protein
MDSKAVARGLDVRILGGYFSQRGAVATSIKRVSGIPGVKDT